MDYIQDELTYALTGVLAADDAQPDNRLARELFQLRDALSRLAGDNWGKRWTYRRSGDKIMITVDGDSYLPVLKATIGSDGVSVSRLFLPNGAGGASKAVVGEIRQFGERVQVIFDER